MKESKTSIFDKVYNYFLKGDKSWKKDVELNRREGSSAFIGGGLGGLSPELSAFVKTLLVFIIPIAILLILVAVVLRFAVSFL